MKGFVGRDVGGVDVVRWVPGETDSSDERIENLGDHLGAAITEEITPRQGGAAGGARLLTAGSVLHAARPGDVVWGSGLNLKLSRPIPAAAAALDYRAVRGPLTRAALLLVDANVPDVLGDPVSLLPEVFPEVRGWVDPRRPVTVVPNLNDLADFQGVPGVVSPTEETWSVVRAIAESELVVGSSLHAIVIAESLGIPARFLLSSVEHPWKYHDYLLATGRSKERFARSVDEAVELGGHATPTLGFADLGAAFPRDLWGATRRPNDTEPEDPAVTLDAVIDLLTEEFDDVHRADRGGLPMARALIRRLGLPAIRADGHRLRSERLEQLAGAVRHLVGDQFDALGLRDEPTSEIAATVAGRSDRPLARLSLRDAVGESARIVSADWDADRFEWGFRGVGLGPSLLGGVTGARIVLLHDGTGTPVPAERLAVAVDDPDFRWTLSLQLGDIPPGVTHFGLRIDWETGSGWVRGPRITRVPGVRAPRHLAPRGAVGWRLREEVPAMRDDMEVGAPDATGGSGNVRRASELTWLGEPGTLELSVIVTAHDVAPWLDEALHSILRQDVERMEVIIVDDHSTDDTAAVIHRYRHDARLVVIDAIDRGGANARNVGAAVSRGRFMVFADGDDLVPDGAYRTLVDRLERSGSDMAIGNFCKFSSTDIWRPSRRWNLFTNEGIGVRVRDVPDLIRNRAVWNRVFRRDFWEEAGLHFPEVDGSNDIAPMTRALLLADRVDIVDRDVYLHRDRPGQTSMTSRSSSTAGLVSYLTQELECVELIAADGDAALLATMTSLFVGADGWAHLHRVASQGEALPPTIVPLVDSILAALPPGRVARQAPERQAVVRLVALGRCDAATAILRHRDDPTGQHAIDLLEGWVEAVEYLPKLTPNDDTHIAWYREHVASALEHVAKGLPGPEIRGLLRRVLELRPPDASDGVATAALEYALAAERPADFRTAMRLLSGRQAPDGQAATIDDWLRLLDRMDDLTTDQARLIWTDRIVPLLESELEEGVVSDDRWQRLIAARHDSMRKHRGRGVRRAAPILAVYDEFGPDGLSAYLDLRARGVVIGRCTVRRERLRLSGTMPAPAGAGRLALHVQRDGRTAATFPITVEQVGGTWRWSAAIDLTLVPLDGRPTLVAEGFRGKEGWYLLRLPLHVAEDAPSRSGGFLRVTDADQPDEPPVVHVTGVPSFRRHVRDVRTRVRRVVRGGLRPVVQAIARS